jgi:hypothetical protein
LNSFFISFFILFFLSLTGFSIAEFQKNASIKVTLFHFFLFLFFTFLGTVGTRPARKRLFFTFLKL